VAIHSAVVDGRFDMGAWGATGMGNLTPLWLLKYLPNMLSCHVTIIHGAEGPSNNITCGSASGHLSIAEGARWIQRGDADVVIAGGAETKLVPLCMVRQELLGRVCTRGNDSPGTACRPFDAGASGTVIGEGGAMLILEDLERAVARGARIYAEFAGAGAACDPAGMHVTEPTAGGLDRAVKRALADAEVPPEQVDLILAHGTGVPGEDRLEAAAWQAALGERAEQVPAWCLTGAIGSTFAGAGALELAAAALALQKQAVCPTVNFETPIDGCRMKFLRQREGRKVDCAVSGAHTVGGQSAAVVLKRYQP
jgi:3-oxoacyl-[acyl-carrier-protein] synthase II